MERISWLLTYKNVLRTLMYSDTDLLFILSAMFSYIESFAKTICRFRVNVLNIQILS